MDGDLKASPVGERKGEHSWLRQSVKERKKERMEDEAVMDVSQNATNHDHDENKKRHVQGIYLLYLGY